jgi:hypothetical protein
MIYSCDFVYDARTRKTCIRSLNIVEVDDPCDIRFWRVPGQYPNNPERFGRLRQLCLVGQIGASGYTAEDARPHTNRHSVLHAQQRHRIPVPVRRDGTITVPRNGGGRQAAADDAICHVMLLHNGTLVIGADTDPQQLPPYSLVVRGNLEIEGFYGSATPSTARVLPAGHVEP